MTQSNVFNSISKVKHIIKKEKNKRVFLVTGKGSYEKSGAKEYLDKCLDDLEVLQYSDFEPNPKIGDLGKGSKLVSDFKPDLMIAVGGGSVLDIAKLISSLPPELLAIEDIITGKSLIKPRTYPLVAIPTTAGSGSECTHFAVAYIDIKKYSVANEKLVPDYVILDPKLTFSMSPYLTAVSGMDAFSQALESYWAVEATKESKEYAKEALKNLLAVFPDVVHKPTAESRKIMLEAAHLAGKAINISKTTGAHAVSYIITMLYGIPHGHAVALSLAEFFDFNFNKKNCSYNGNMKHEDFNIIENELLTVLKCKNIVEGKRKIESVFLGSNLQNKLKDVGANNRKEIDNIIKNVNIERLNNNPKKIDKMSLENIISNIF